MRPGAAHHREPVGLVVRVERVVRRLDGGRVRVVARLRQRARDDEDVAALLEIHLLAGDQPAVLLDAQRGLLRGCRGDDRAHLEPGALVHLAGREDFLDHHLVAVFVADRQHVHAHVVAPDGFEFLLRRAEVLIPVAHQHDPLQAARRERGEGQAQRGGDARPLRVSDRLQAHRLGRDAAAARRLRSDRLQQRLRVRPPLERRRSAEEHQPGRIGRVALLRRLPDELQVLLLNLRRDRERLIHGVDDRHLVADE